MAPTTANSFAELFGALDFDRPLDVDDPADLALYVAGLHRNEDTELRKPHPMRVV